jgi:hypothetical protein
MDDGDRRGDPDLRVARSLGTKKGRGRWPVFTKGVAAWGDMDAAFPSRKAALLK